MHFSWRAFVGFAVLNGSSRSTMAAIRAKRGRGQYLPGSTTCETTAREGEETQQTKTIESRLKGGSELALFLKLSFCGFFGLLSLDE